MGGHGPAIQGTTNNIQEDDATLSHRIREIELIKHNPQLFYVNPFDLNNIYEIAGGAKTCAFAVVAGGLSLSYFLGSRRSQAYNFYINMHQGFYRTVTGGLVGAAFGYNKFGDRQRLHNAYVAERLRRRYPESKMLNVTDLWQYKNVHASQDYYRWL